MTPDIMTIIYICYTAFACWLLWTLAFGGGVVLRQWSCRLLAALHAEAVTLDSRWIRRRNAEANGWSINGRDRARTQHARLIIRSHVWELLAAQPGPLNEATLIRAQECTENPGADPFERRAVARYQGAWVAGLSSGLAPGARKEFLDGLTCLLKSHAPLENEQEHELSVAGAPNASGPSSVCGPPCHDIGGRQDSTDVAEPGEGVTAPEPTDDAAHDEENGGLASFALTPPR